MKINEVERLVGVTKRNIRFYEKEGLLAPDRNAENGYRDYGEADVETLKKIKLLRKLDLPLEEIRRMQRGTLTLSDGMAPPCDPAGAGAGESGDDEAAVRTSPGCGGDAGRVGGGALFGRDGADGTGGNEFCEYQKERHQEAICWAHSRRGGLYRADGGGYRSDGLGVCRGPGGGAASAGADFLAGASGSAR